MEELFTTILCEARASALEMNQKLCSLKITGMES